MLEFIIISCAVVFVVFFAVTSCILSNRYNTELDNMYKRALRLNRTATLEELANDDINDDFIKDIDQVKFFEEVEKYKLTRTSH